MKKLISIFLSLVFIITLSACAETYAEMTAEEVTQQLLNENIHPEGFEPLIVAEVFPDEDQLQLIESSSKVTMDSMGISSYDLIVYVANEGKANELKNMLQERFDMMVDQLEEGYGGEIGKEIAANSVLEVRGDYVVFFISPRGNEALEAFLDIVKK